MTTATNPALTGNYAPVSEERTDFDLPVTGSLPQELCGRYLRNGPNPATAQDPATYQWFTGDGMVHGVRLRDGRAEWYRNRFIREASVAKALGETPPAGCGGEHTSVGPNTNVIGFQGRTFALVEAGTMPFELTYELDSVGFTDFAGGLTNGYSGHPKRDPVTGELHAISYYWADGNVVRYTVLGTDGQIRRSVPVEAGGPIMLHDMSLTERYAVIYDLPVLFNMDAAMQGVQFPYFWDENYQARVGLLPRDGDGDDVKWFDVSPCYVFHPLNAYDDGDRVVLDVVRHRRMFADRELWPDGTTATLDRWTIDTAAGSVHEQRLDDRAQEFPRVDERRVGLAHRFGYSVMQDSDIHTGNAIIKHDTQRGRWETRVLSGEPGEAVFVPRSAAAAEDDGWVLSLVYDADRDASDLLVLNAQDFAGEPQAVVHLPVRAPAGFHGNWVADDE